MQHGMPSEVRVDAMGDHARYLLPRRDLGAVRWVGLMPILLGCVMLAFIGAFARGMRVSWSTDGAGRVYACVAAAFLIVLVFPILRLLVFGLIVVAGRAEIRWVNGQLSAREHAGPVFWTRRLKLKTPVQRVSVGYGDGIVRINGKPSPRFAALARLAIIGVEAGPDKKDRFLLAMGYPKEMLLAVGEDLAHRMHVDFRSGLMRGAEWVEAAQPAESRS